MAINHDKIREAVEAHKRMSGHDVQYHDGDQNDIPLSFHRGPGGCGATIKPLFSKGQSSDKKMG